MNTSVSKDAANGPALRIFTLLLVALSSTAVIKSQEKPEAYLRFESQAGAATVSYYVEVYMMTPLEGGDVSRIRASLRDMSEKKLLSTTVEGSPESTIPPSGTSRPQTNFRIPLNGDETAILKKASNLKVFVDTYPTSSGNKDAEIAVRMDVNVTLIKNASCRRKFSVLAAQVSNTRRGRERIDAVHAFFRQPNLPQDISAEVTQDGITTPRTVRSVGLPNVHEPENPKDKKSLFVCIEFTQPPPPGDYNLGIAFDADATPELRRPINTLDLTGPNVADAESEKRNVEDFLDVGLTLTSSVAEEKQEDGTSLRKRTTRGLMDLFFAPVLNMRTVGTLGDHGGLVQVMTPFFIDAKVATGKITDDTLALNTINLGFDYEFRHYLNTNAYPDLMRHALNFRHTSDRDFKQDEFKFTYEFQPIFGAINQPLGSAPNILKDEVVEDTEDKFGFEIVPLVGVELGRTYRVRNPKDFEGVSRNVRRLYFGGHVGMNITRHFRLYVDDLFYVRGESPLDRTENYFMGTAEAPLGRIGQSRAAHALYFSFERGEQPPFANPSVNVVKFGYRIRGRGFLF